MRITRILAWVLLALGIVLLTALTQIGGALLLVAALAARPLGRALRWRPVAAGTLLFALLYGLGTFVAVPAIAPAFGRVALPCIADEDTPLAAQPVFCALGRRYATPQTRDMLVHLARDLAAEHPGTVLQTLDVSFPFDWFRMLPHYLHRRGDSVDIALFYTDDAGAPAAPPSPIGYFVYVQPEAGEPRPCEGVPSIGRWDFEWLQGLSAGARLDEGRTRTMLDWLNAHASEYTIRFVLLEAHLVRRLGVGGVVRPQGCQAARHDDHIHVERRP